MEIRHCRRIKSEIGARSAKFVGNGGDHHGSGIMLAVNGRETALRGAKGRSPTTLPLWGLETLHRIDKGVRDASPLPPLRLRDFDRGGLANVRSSCAGD